MSASHWALLAQREAITIPLAAVAELVDAPVSQTGIHQGYAGSSPVCGTFATLISEEHPNHEQKNETAIA